MSAGNLARGGVVGMVMKWAARLRFPYLLLLTALVFTANLFIPDVLPFADEIIMGLVTVLLANLKKPSAQEGDGEDRTADAGP